MYRRRPVIEKLVYALVAALVTFLVGHLVLQRNDRLFDVSIALLLLLTVRYYAFLLLLAVAVVAVDFVMRQVRTGMAEFYDGPRIPGCATAPALSSPGLSLSRRRT